MPYKDPEKNREYKRNWAREKKRHIEYKQRIRREAIEMLGEKCVYCGCNDYDALEFNHINGEGNKRSNNSKSLPLEIVKGRIPKEEIELTCKICNSWHYLVKLKKIYNGWTITWKPLNNSM